MLNFLYENYPYGTSETFVEYEMRALAEITDEEFKVYVLRPSGKAEKYIPENVTVSPIEKGSVFSYMCAFFKMFYRSSLKEVYKVLKNRYPEGTIKCIYRIYRYRLVAERFLAQYKKQKRGSQDTFVSYWLNECAFALTELKKKYPEIRIASRGHGYDVFEDRCYMPFRKEILSGLDKVFVINDASKLYFKAHYGDWFDLSKTEIAHLGVDLPEKMSEKSDRKVFRIATCSSVIPLKRLDLMIDALSGITDKDIEWVHLGGGPLLDSIKEYASQKLSNSSVKYSFLGQMPLKDIHTYYASTPIHLFVNCSDTEGTPVSVMEAMSYGIPVIARDVGGMGEVVDNNSGKLLSKNSDSELLKSAIEDIFSISQDDYLKMCQSAREKIEKEFDAEKTFKAYINTIRHL